MVEVTVAADELKERLGEYLDRVRAGDTVLITEGDKPVARVLPVADTRSPEGKLHDLVKAGVIEWGGGRFVPVRPRAKLIGSKTVSELLVEDRG
ncbi:MAG: type II toxin-antitoxin system Phd/YefM family antitoxin [Anaerolineae bacterium]